MVPLWRVAGGGVRVEGGGWRVDGGGWRSEGAGWGLSHPKLSVGMGLGQVAGAGGALTADRTAFALARERVGRVVETKLGRN